MDAGDWNLSGAFTMRKSYVIYVVTMIILRKLELWIA